MWHNQQSVYCVWMSNVLPMYWCGGCDTINERSVVSVESWVVSFRSIVVVDVTQSTTGRWDMSWWCIAVDELSVLSKVGWVVSFRSVVVVDVTRSTTGPLWVCWGEICLDDVLLCWMWHNQRLVHFECIRVRYVLATCSWGGCDTLNDWSTMSVLGWDMSWRCVAVLDVTQFTTGPLWVY